MKKFTTVAATLAMVLVAAVPAYAQDATIEGDDNSESNETFLLAGDNSQVALNDSSQSLDQTAFQYNSPVVNIDGDENQVAQGGNSVEADQAQYSFNVLFGGFNDADFDGIDDSFDYFIAFGDFDGDGVDDELEN
ncbi:hypothetical protein GBA65_18350 [Rubrobacter marinus]|uniref:Uncharacterized protein n=1 Tax=Rubrobacter marinus TaxID=2653852 RepID=A0A6G8Q0Z6_9ACTN|nr:hypothetical protein [Rubrobacter marinus]QIN80154.1 hypothetical protein GBA65_18350 [Rubrobacter marinus]